MALIQGTAISDTLIGGQPNDRLVGNAGDDYLDGFGGNDKLEGGEGNDVLANDFGSDTFTGGNGADIFYFNPVLYTGVDIVTDFNPQVDTIQVSLGGFGGVAEDFTYDQHTGDLFYSGDKFASLSPNLNFDPTTDIDLVA